MCAPPIEIVILTYAGPRALFGAVLYTPVCSCDHRHSTLESVKYLCCDNGTVLIKEVPGFKVSFIRRFCCSMCVSGLFGVKQVKLLSGSTYCLNQYLWLLRVTCTTWYNATFTLLFLLPLPLPPPMSTPRCLKAPQASMPSTQLVNSLETSYGHQCQRTCSVGVWWVGLWVGLSQSQCFYVRC